MFECQALEMCSAWREVAIGTGEIITNNGPLHVRTFCTFAPGYFRTNFLQPSARVNTAKTVPAHNNGPVGQTRQGPDILKKGWTRWRGGATTAPGAKGSVEPDRDRQAAHLHWEFCVVSVAC